MGIDIQVKVEFSNEERVRVFQGAQQGTTFEVARKTPPEGFDLIIDDVPLCYGAGMKGKIGTSVSYGVPCVATSIAVEGLGFEQEEHILVRDTS